MQIAVGAVLAAGLLGWYGASLYETGALAYYQTLEEFRSAADLRPARVHGYVAAGSIERDVPARQVRFMLQSAPPRAASSAASAAPSAQSAPKAAPAAAAPKAQSAATAATGGGLAVAYAGLDVPDLFGPGAEVVVEGRLTASGVFAANNVLAKCPSKFESAPTAPTAPTAQTGGAGSGAGAGSARAAR